MSTPTTLTTTGANMSTTSTHAGINVPNSIPLGNTSNSTISNSYGSLSTSLHNTHIHPHSLTNQSVLSNPTYMAASGTQVYNEEISTIFVVGFPDDMQEREFQNMFVFAAGFEAATLKVPSKEQDNGNEDLTGVSNGNNPRKQTIGFAKFRTRAEAIEARDMLSGKKVDAEKGSVLKAEMAKKNLHTKRGLSNENGTVHNSANLMMLNPLQQQQPDRQDPRNNSFSQMTSLLHPTANASRQVGQRAGSLSAYDAFYSVPPFGPALPSDLLSPSEYAYDSFNSVDNLKPGTPTASAFGTSVNNNDVFGRGSFDARSNEGLGGLVSSRSNALGNGSIGQSQSAFKAGSFTKSFFDFDDDNSSLSYLSKSTPVHSDRGFNSVLFNSDDLTNIGSRFNSLSISTNNNSNNSQNVANGGNLPSPGLASPGFRPPNPADQNPPCNTLYVGNLPPNTSEEELKQMFSRCVGYKRLSFKNKPNGPMCFVEFEDIGCATQALNDLNGNPLSNSVKGGIRLSFSKNPLGVRQNPNASGNTSSSTPNYNSTSQLGSSPIPMGVQMVSPNGPVTTGAYSYERRESFLFDPQF